MPQVRQLSSVISLAAAAAAAAAATLAAPARAALLTVRGDAPYQIFDGIGGMSSGGTSRLLLDYPEPQRAQILDLLFLPNFGMSSQILKLEVGGDGQSTDGTEAAFKHYREEPAQCGVNRGYESWLLGEALARNANITSYLLSWAAPSWVGNGSFLSTEGVQFHVDYARCLRDEFGGGHPHFIGTWNECMFSDDYIVALRRELLAAGLDTKVIAADGPSCGPAGDTMTNATLVESLYAIGQHYSCGHGGGCPAANAAGLKFWVSEDFSVNGEVFDGAAYWGSRLSLNWVLLNATATISWALVWSAYDSFGYRGCGLMSAYTPWSGNYLVGDAVWMTAHHTQFMWPGWRLLQSLGNSSAGSSGVLPGGGSWVAARSPDGADFSLVIETLQATDAGYCAPWAPTSAQNLTFLLAPGTGLPGPGSHLQYWQTVEGAAFVHLPDLVVAADGTVSVSVPHQSKVTISTITTASKGGVNASSIPPAAPFALPYADNFDEASYPYDHVPRFLSDTSSTGSFAVRHGVLQQVALALNMNNGWCGCCGFGGPVTTIGEADWLNYTARVSVSFNSGPADRGDASPLPPPPSSPSRSPSLSSLPPPPAPSADCARAPAARMRAAASASLASLRRATSAAMRSRSASVLARPFATSTRHCTSGGSGAPCWSIQGVTQPSSAAAEGTGSTSPPTSASAAASRELSTSCSTDSTSAARASMLARHAMLASRRVATLESLLPRFLPPPPLPSPPSPPSSSPSAPLSSPEPSPSLSAASSSSSGPV
jgi:hypothetical protein